MEEYEKWDLAADLVNRGWVQGKYQANDHYCLVGAINKARPIDSPFGLYVYGYDFLDYRLTLPEQDALNQHLRHCPSYMVSRLNGRSIRESAIKWNDKPWRRQKTVEKVLRAIANESRAKSALALSVEVQTLRREVEQLRARVAQLEAENGHLWSRLRNRGALAQDRERLEEIERELAASWDELQTVNATKENA